mmetsp:Transcript_17347/g.24701  ORF Transcript_17347/g.24701 Transcript_17347/m.24701 type:complete len:111 (+) Transcript_17347:59-391(+)
MDFHDVPYVALRNGIGSTKRKKGESYSALVLRNIFDSKTFWYHHIHWVYSFEDLLCMRGISRKVSFTIFISQTSHYWINAVETSNLIPRSLRSFGIFRALKMGEWIFYSI